MSFNVVLIITGLTLDQSSAVLALNKPLALLKRPITFQPKQFFVHGAKALAKLATLNVDGASVSAMDLINDTGLKRTPEEASGWLMVGAAFTRE